MAIKVIKGGLFTTIQDLGRYRYQQFGVPVGGPMDEYSFKLANYIIGNDENDACLEVTIIGPVLQFLCDTIICISGANLSPMINGKKVDNHRPITVQSNDILSFQGVRQGCRAYISVKNGIHIQPILESRSYFPHSDERNSILLRPIQKGDILPVKPFSKIKCKWSIKGDQDLFNTSIIRYFAGPQFHYFSIEEIFRFEKSKYSILPESNRIGYRLKGDALSISEKHEMISEGTTFGSIQVPHDGQPIILMSDRQPTGGYPKLGQVAFIDLPKLAQKKPGDSIQFQRISLDDAYSLKKRYEKKLRLLKMFLKEKWNETKY